VEFAHFGRRWASGVVEVSTDLEDLRSGFWGVVVTFEGSVTAVRFADVDAMPRPLPPWTPLEGAWSTSLDRTAYVAGVCEIRDRIAAGDVYQVNLCRVLSHPLPPGSGLAGLAPLLAAGNPAPHAATIHVPSAGLQVLCASPEAYLLRDGDRIVSRPIKGTASSRETMLVKDYAENVMITDLVRNDLGRVCQPGTVGVRELCATEVHPGLVHLVTDVAGVLRPGTSWTELLEATFPPGSVSGAPKHTALAAIADLEPVPRGPYCGAIGWIDADTGRAELAVGIRTFWVEEDDVGAPRVSFGSGAGITWGSDPEQEWRETSLKTARLIGLASGKVVA
jgi:para-aminobenzoate synthetase component 1